MTLVNNPITATQIKRMHVLLAATGKVAYKQDLMDWACIDGRYPTSSKQLYECEASKIIDYLQGLQNEPLDKMRKKIISCCREMGWIKGGKADMQRVYAWVLKYGYLHKPLNQYTAAELPRLVTQAENMKNDYLKAV